MGLINNPTSPTTSLFATLRNTSGPSQITTRAHLSSPSTLFNVQSMGSALYFLLMVYFVLSVLSISRLRSILKFIPTWSALKLLYTTIAIHLCTRTLGLMLLVLLSLLNSQTFSFQFQTILFTFPEYCFITLYLITIVQWITSLLNAYGHGSGGIVNGSKCRKWTRILFFSACVIVFASITIFYTLLWFKPDSTSEQIETSCMFLNLGTVALAILIAFMMYCCVLSRHMNTSYVILQIAKKLSYTVVVASIGRVFRAVILIISSFFVWQDSMEQSTLAMSIISILSLCELFPLFLLLDWRLVFLLLGGEEIVEAKIGDVATVSLFVPFLSGAPNESIAGHNSLSVTPTGAVPSLNNSLRDHQDNGGTYTRIFHQPLLNSSGNQTSSGTNPLNDGDGDKLLEEVDPLLLPHFNIETSTGPCFDPMTLSLPRALFLPNNETLNVPPTVTTRHGLEVDNTIPSSIEAEDKKNNQLWNGIYYGFYHDKLTTMAQIIYTNPLWITCSGYTQDGKRIAVKRFVLPGLDETALRELGIEAYSRGQLSIQCQNILPVLGFNVSGSSLCIISEYKQRRSLFDFVRSTEKNIAPIGILKLTLGIALGLECLHNNDIVHGHFSSRNVILDESLQVYISDVGDRFVRIFAEAMYGGHLHNQWTAPEVLNGGNPTKSSDVYSFGVVCWELCYRLIPFQYYSLKDLHEHVGKRGDRLLLPSSDEIAKAQMLAKNQGKSLRYVIPYEFISLITRCLHDVNLRPSFTDIVATQTALLASLESLQRQEV